MRTARTLRRQSDLGYSASQIAALATVSREGPLTPSEFAEREGVQRPTATNVIARLGEEGLVSRTQDPADGRSCRVAITPQGAKLLASIRGRKNAVLVKGLARLEADDRATLERAAELLERMLEGEA
ncbi:MAG: MarR family winged helix-turn-helix transcriptional regulator [Solirubrobacteraceae bacterium]